MQYLIFPKKETDHCVHSFMVQRICILLASVQHQVTHRTELKKCSATPQILSPGILVGENTRDMCVVADVQNDVRLGDVARLDTSLGSVTGLVFVTFFDVRVAQKASWAAGLAESPSDLFLI